MLLSKLYSIAFLQPGRADLNLESGTCLSSALKCGGGGLSAPHRLLFPPQLGPHQPRIQVCHIIPTKTVPLWTEECSLHSPVTNKSKAARPFIFFPKEIVRGILLSGSAWLGKEEAQMTTGGPDLGLAAYSVHPGQPRPAPVPLVLTEPH